VLEAAGEIMRACVEAGGSLTGEHGVGFEKQRYMPWLYSETDLENMQRVRGAFGNHGLFNPCKILPEGTGCGEMAHHEAAVRRAGPDSYV
jgi:glycolate oxidase